MASSDKIIARDNPHELFQIHGRALPATLILWSPDFPPP